MEPKALLAILLISFCLFFAGCLGGQQTAKQDAEYKPANQSKGTYPVLPVEPYNESLNISPPAPIEITFLNVGYGDAALIRSEGKTILFDAGPNTDAKEVAAFLRNKRISKIDLLVLSSNDPLFVSGAPEILRSFEVGEVWYNGGDYSDSLWAQIMGLAKEHKIKAVQYSDSFEEGNFSLLVLNPFEGERNTNPAMDSIALKAQYNDFCAVLFSNSEASGASGSDPGTVSGGVDNRIISGSIPVAGCQVLKVSHHGSANSASFQLLDNMKPEAAIISVGRNPPQNLYPSEALIRRLLLRNTSIYTTDKLGDITVSSEGKGYEIKTEFARNTAYAQFLNQVGYGGMKYYN